MLLEQSNTGPVKAAIHNRLCAATEVTLQRNPLLRVTEAQRAREQRQDSWPCGPTAAATLGAEDQAQYEPGPSRHRPCRGGCNAKMGTIMISTPKPREASGISDAFHLRERS
jgi:hypothetical protein